MGLSISACSTAFRYSFLSPDLLLPALLPYVQIYTWGAGRTGQLGQGDEQVSPKPRLVERLVDDHIHVTRLVCGAFHNAALTLEGAVYTWGSTLGGCLGRPRSLEGLEAGFTAVPGRVEGLDSWGKGEVIDVAVGRYFTVLVTAPWEGMPEEEWLEWQQQLLEEEAEERARLAELERERLAQLEAERVAERKRRIRLLNTTHRICDFCAAVPPYNKCPGFLPNAFRPTQCHFCSHERDQHNKKRIFKDSTLTDEDLLAQMKQLVTKEEERMLMDLGDDGEEEAEERKREAEEEALRKKQQEEDEIFTGKRRNKNR